MRLYEVMTRTMDRFADRPALADRGLVPRGDPRNGTTGVAPGERYETTTYAELWRRVRSVASQLTCPEAAHPLGVGDKVLVLGSASPDYVTADLACNLTGLTTVPLPVSVSRSQHKAIGAETRPKALIANLTEIGQLDGVVELFPSLARLIIIDYRADLPAHRETMGRITAALSASGTITVETADVSREVSNIPAPDGDPDSDMTMLLYTSGSTGSPKGAIYTERLVAEMWGGEGWSEFFGDDQAVSTFHYMPMSHVAGHSSVRSVLARGGTTYFASTNDLSSLLDDLRLARPTELSLVPRVCELLLQEYQRRIHAARRYDTEDSNASPAAIMKRMRDEVLGNQVKWVSCTSAPVSDSVKKFIEDLLGLKLHVLYGTTEIGGVMADGEFLRPPVVDFRLEDVPELGYFTSDVPHPRGELIIKSTSTVPGYYNRPELSNAVFTPDGYYRTGDIATFDDSGRISIIDRKNAVIKLSQGEFVALPSLEAKYTASSGAIHQVFLYGDSGRSYLLALVVPTRETLDAHADDSSLKEALIHEFRAIAAKEGLNSYEIPRGVIVEQEPFSVSNGLLSDHRKVLRPEIIGRYRTRFAELYQQLSESGDAALSELLQFGADAPTFTTLTRAIAVALGGNQVAYDPDAKFRELGGDSLSAVHLSRLLEQIYDTQIPVDVVVSESYTLRGLAEYLDKKRLDTRPKVSYEDVHGTRGDTLHAADLLLGKFIDGEVLAAADTLPLPGWEPRRILLTGASGYLGRVLCLDWLRRMAAKGGTVVCLVRARDDQSALARLRASYASDERMLEEFDALGERLEVLAGDLAEPTLGLTVDRWGRLAAEVDLIVHVGAMVNHVLPYRDMFTANVLGTAEIIRLALTGRRKAINYLSSIAAATIPNPNGPLDEYADIRKAAPSVPSGGGYAAGYAATKWAGEILLREANERFSLPVTVFRPSMILAHSSYRGQINAPDAFARLLYSLLRTGIAPASFYHSNAEHAHYDGLPVDAVASSIAGLGERNRGEYQTYNVVNPHDDGVSLDRIVDWIIADGVRLQRIERYDEWLLRFEKALRALPEDDRRKSTFALLHKFEKPEGAKAGSLVESKRHVAALEAMSGDGGSMIRSLDREYVRKAVRDVEYAFGFAAPRSTASAATS